MNGIVQTNKTVICRLCQSETESGFRFCTNCGGILPVAHSASLDTIMGAPDVTAQLPAQDPLSGRTIEGKYRIDGVIGAGGMGAVYRATRLLIGDEVAIKILHTERIADPHAGERFRREAQAAARLKHPNAVSIYDFGVSSDGLQYLVMELVEGQSLRQLIRQQGPLSVSLVAQIAAQVCEALDEAHRQHIVHRDVKPDNIILNRTAAGLRVKVLDFGIAKLRDDTASHLTQTGSVMGTPHYMSPEQCLGEELDSRADIYSIGIVLYEMLCGRVPFESPTATAVVVQHVNQMPAPLRSINPSVPPEVESVVLRALQKRPEARQQTAGALAKELAAAIARTPAGYAHQYHAEAPPSLQYQNTEDERTVERAYAAATSEPSKPTPDLAPTVHLANLSGATGSVVGGRATTGSGSLAVAADRQGVAVKIGIVAAAVIVLGIIGLLIALRLTQTEAGNTNLATNANRDNQATAAVDNPKREHTGSPTPPGMVLVSGRTFMMGSNEDDEDARPAHPVTVKPFVIDVFEVTCEDYKKFVDETHRAAPATWRNGDYPVGAARHPVTGVNWEDADAYAHWVAKRLPTEEEWEMAARGQAGLKYPWGDTWKAGCANADEEGRARKGMADVGSHRCASPAGAFDMIGNAWEWTASDWVPYPGGHIKYPTAGGEKVIRGGSWESPQQFATGIYRSGIPRTGNQTGYDQTGFRCARDAEP